MVDPIRYHQTTKFQFPIGSIVRYKCNGQNASGTVKRRLQDIDSGQFYYKIEVTYEISDTKPSELVTEVSEDDLLCLSAGCPVRVTMNSTSSEMGPEEPLDGQILYGKVDNEVVYTVRLFLDKEKKCYKIEEDVAQERVKYRETTAQPAADKQGATVISTSPSFDETTVDFPSYVEANDEAGEDLPLGSYNEGMSNPTPRSKKRSRSPGTKRDGAKSDRANQGKNARATSKKRKKGRSGRHSKRDGEENKAKEYQEFRWDIPSRWVADEESRKALYAHLRETFVTSRFDLRIEGTGEGTRVAARISPLQRKRVEGIVTRKMCEFVGRSFPVDGVTLK